MTEHAGGASGPFRAGGEGSGRGAANQGEARHRDVIETGRNMYLGWRGNKYLSTGEAICCCPDEGSKKSTRKPVYENLYFWNRDAVGSGMVVVRMSFRLDFCCLLQGSRK